MKIKTIILTASKLSLLSLFLCNNAQAEELTNYICFAKTQVNSFDPITYSKSPNTIWDGTVYVPESGANAGCLGITESPENSSIPLDWVKNNEEATFGPNYWNDQNMVCSYHFNSTPDNLVLAYTGTFNFTQNNVQYQCKNVYIGLGQTWAIQKENTINWWLFSNNNDENQTISCTDSNGDPATFKVNQTTISEEGKFTLNLQ